MATQTKESPARTEPELEQHKTSGAKQTAEKGVKSLQAFWTKFNNDWVMNFAAGLAFNLITAIFPIAIAIIAIAGLIFGSFDPYFQGNLIHSIESVFPQQISSGHILEPARISRDHRCTYRYLRWFASLRFNRKLFRHHLPYTSARCHSAEHYGSRHASAVCHFSTADGLCFLHTSSRAIDPQSNSCKPDSGQWLHLYRTWHIYRFAHYMGLVRSYLHRRAQSAHQFS